MLQRATVLAETATHLRPPLPALRKRDSFVEFRVPRHGARVVERSYTRTVSHEPTEQRVKPLTDEEQQKVVEQYEELRGRSQRAFDDALRAIAAGAVVVTASLASAFHGAGVAGVVAVAFSLLALWTNLASFVTPQLDASYTKKRAWARDRHGVFNSPWRRVTGYLNFVAFAFLIAAGISLLVFVSSL